MDSEYEIIWSARAKITFFNVLDYLNENWTKKEMVQFNTRIQITLNAIKKNPGIFPLSTKNREIRKAYIDRNNLLFYMFDNNNRKIYLLTFFDCRQDPNKLISKY